ncbi:MAG: hypothetical protein ACXAB7_17465 [Candidatus Kariarchaeaceae archaeon]|jgi:hypothetical protein
MEDYETILSEELAHYVDEIKYKVLESFKQSVDDLYLGLEYELLVKNLGSPKDFIKEYIDAHGYEINDVRKTPIQTSFEKDPYAKIQFPVSQSLEEFDEYGKGWLSDNIPTTLFAVILLQWFGFLFWLIIGILTISKDGDQISQLWGTIFVTIALVSFWLARELRRYNNTARKVAIWINVISSLLNIVTFNLIGLSISAFIVFALVYDRELKSKFENNYI